MTCCWVMLYQFTNLKAHKAKAVILVTHHTHRTNINRNLLYVGVSRAQEQLIQISDINGIEIGLDILANERNMVARYVERRRHNMDISGMGDIQQIPFQTLLHDSSVELRLP